MAKKKESHIENQKLLTLCVEIIRGANGARIIEHTKIEKESLKKNMIEITHDLKDIVISALRYALGQKTYITGVTADFIMNNPELLDERVRKVMLNDLQQYFNWRNESIINDDDCDYQSWRELYSFLGETKQ